MKIAAKELEALLSGNHILKGVDLEINDRELVGVIGPNGSGKSTLLKCIYRVLKPSGGAVYLDGKELDSYAYRDSARRLAVVAQHNYYNFEFSVQDVVLMGRAPHKRALDRDNAEDYKIVADALETVEMSSFSKRSFSTLSGGEQQRVILARALAQQTPCLILDEPTNHLDLVYQKQVFHLVQEWVKEPGRAVISVVHDLSLARAYGTHALLMQKGRIVSVGPVEKVMTPEHLNAVYSMDVFAWMQNLYGQWKTLS